MSSERNQTSPVAADRREFLRKGLVAGGIVAAAPVITSFTTPAGAQVGSSTVYSFQYTRASANACTAVASTTNFAGTASGCALSGFTSGENTATNASSVGLVVSGCAAAPTFTLPDLGSCTFGTGAVTTKSGNDQVCKANQSAVAPTLAGKLLTFSQLESNEILRFTVSC